MAHTSLPLTNTAKLTMTTKTPSQMPPRMPKPRSPRFWNFFAKRYSRMAISDEAAYRKKLDITQSHLTKEMDLLEFGCGTGGTALIHAPFVRHIQAIDNSSKMIEIARTKAQDAGTPNVTFTQTAIETLATPPASYDAILGLSILHLLEDRQAVLARVHQLLKPGGLFFSSTVCAREMGLAARIILPVIGATGFLPKVAAFTSQELAAEIEAAGFRIVKNCQPGPEKVAFIVARKTP